MARRPIRLKDITDETPLMLGIAAELAFPDGSVTTASLRRERDKGNLAVSRIAGKDYTTLGAIRAMLEQSRQAVMAEKRAAYEARQRLMADARTAPTKQPDNAKVALQALLSQTRQPRPGTKGESNGNLRSAHRPRRTPSKG